ncbi:MAG: phosphoribosylglycinamide formyltransferase [Cellvibrio sp.]
MSEATPATKPMRLVVLISGSGSNLQALIDAKARGDLPVDIAAVVSNRPMVQGLTRAQNAGIPTLIIDHKEFSSREAFDQELISLIDAYEPDLVVLAGFMRILTPQFTEHYLGRMLNIHPSLLPKYQGLNTHQRAIDAGDSRHGVTVHFVTAELDGGPACIQASVPILENDDAGLLAKRVQKQEHIIYPLAVKWFAERRLVMKEGKAFLDGTPLPASGHLIESEDS